MQGHPFFTSWLIETFSVFIADARGAAVKSIDRAALILLENHCNSDILVVGRYRKVYKWTADKIHKAITRECNESQRTFCAEGSTQNLRP